MPTTGPGAWTPIWLTQLDLENALSQATIAACFDDGTPEANAVAIAAIITQAEVETLSWLGDYGPPPFSTEVLTQLGSDTFLKMCALEFAKAFTFDRHPEYVRANGKERGERFQRAEMRMQRVLDARQRPPQTTQPTKAVGGAVVQNEGTVYTPDPNTGADNGGDY